MATAAESLSQEPGDSIQLREDSERPLVTGDKVLMSSQKDFLRFPHAIFTRSHKEMGGKPAMVSKMQNHLTSGAQ